ncbi:MAG: response regulator [Planctomycetes bacterium]|jgi:DNA-binding response OmpR family regulator|nr:response regulator [Planctomycetota bacterium]
MTGEGARLLIVDDEEELVSALVERLIFRGYAVEGAADGRQALARVKERPFDVVVADLKMPRLGGIELMRTLRRDFPHLRVILITGHGRPDEQVAALADMADGLLLKPFAIEALVAKVEEVLGRGPGGRRG